VLLCFLNLMWCYAVALVFGWLPGCCYAVFSVLWELRHCYAFAQCDFIVLLCDCHSIRVVARVLLCSCEDVQNRGINMHLPFVNMFCMAFSLLLCGCYSIWMVAMVLPRCSKSFLMCCYTVFRVLWESRCCYAICQCVLNGF